ncbi:hypothetical protein NDU88_005989 [Pleurodeles waltl]|uniref:Uncharacterized protein n=1 Tax=Pleurodeles waltl TaxID=8319 RepID=A0AAV7VKM7_PLEWA|nr:hypothetical protein NDU88_005989 [Pleurodeles waltl]
MRANLPSPHCSARAPCHHLSVSIQGASDVAEHSGCRAAPVAERTPTNPLGPASASCSPETLLVGRGLGLPNPGGRRAPSVVSAVRGGATPHPPQRVLTRAWSWPPPLSSAAELSLRPRPQRRPRAQPSRTSRDPKFWGTDPHLPRLGSRHAAPEPAVGLARSGQHCTQASGLGPPRVSTLVPSSSAGRRFSEVSLPEPPRF